MTPIRLDGATVAITGGARGIGLATAKAFSARGARVFIGDLDGRLATDVAAEMGGRGFDLDVRSRASFGRFLQAVEASGAPLAVLVNNAGIMPAGRFVAEDDAVTDAILDINTRGVLIGTKLALPGMLKRGTGHIVNVASYLGRVPAAGLATYCASKFAVVGFSEALRDELAGSGVTVSAVLPSAVRTELIAGVKSGGSLTHGRPGNHCRRGGGHVPAPSRSRRRAAMDACVRSHRRGDTGPGGGRRSRSPHPAAGIGEAGPQCAGRLRRADPDNRRNGVRRFRYSQ